MDYYVSNPEVTVGTSDPIVRDINVEMRQWHVRNYEARFFFL